MALPVWTDAQILAQLISGQQWASNDLTYGFPVSTAQLTGEKEKAGFLAFNAQQQSFGTLALLLWDDLIEPDFTLDNLNSDIEFAYTDTAIGFAHAYYPEDGTIWFNKDRTILTAPVIGDDGFSTFVHEIGHALGLEHAGNYDGEGDWTPSNYQDSTVYTIMSYFGPDWRKGEGDVAWANWTGVDGVLYSPQTPALYDIVAIQKIYGIETNTRVSDTIYGFNSNIMGVEKAIFDFIINKNPIITLFDSGGVDTLDLSGWSKESLIDLNPGAFSSANGMTNNIAIAFSAIIEHATGGAANDRLVGNSHNNRLMGLGGNDEINSGEGIDTAVYTGSYRDYRIIYDKETGIFTVEDNITARDGRDSVSDTEYFQFADQKIAAFELTPKDPVVGTPGNDLFRAISGDQDYNGLGGFDVIMMSGNRAQYQISSRDTKIFTGDLVAARDGYDSAILVEELRFSDGKLIFDVASTPDNALVYRLYHAAFARVPDEAGFRFWSDVYADGIKIDDIAGQFRLSNEFTDRYGSALSVGSYIDQLYLNALGRSAEPAGRDFWIEQLGSGRITGDQALVAFADSPENREKTAANIDNGFWLI